MKIRKSNGSIYITSEKSPKYLNAASALFAMQSLQFVMASQSYLTTSHISLETKKIELTIHLETFQTPIIPKGYSFTWKEVHSSSYWSNYTNSVERVRTITYYFEY